MMETVAKKIKELAISIKRNNYTQPMTVTLTVPEIRALDAFISLWK